MTDFLSLCKDRYAVRKFTDKMVSEEDIVYLKEAIRLAPSAANRQPWKFIPNRSLEKASCHFLMTAIRKTALYILDP